MSNQFSLSNKMINPQGELNVPDLELFFPVVGYLAAFNPVYLTESRQTTDKLALQALCTLSGTPSTPRLFPLSILLTPH